MTDQGFSYADQTITIVQGSIEADTAERLWYLFRTYALVVIITIDGAFRAAIQDVKFEVGLRAKILIKERIS